MATKKRLVDRCVFKDCAAKPAFMHTQYDHDVLVCRGHWELWIQMCNLADSNAKRMSGSW